MLRLVACIRFRVTSSVATRCRLLSSVWGMYYSIPRRKRETCLPPLLCEAAIANISAGAEAKSKARTSAARADEAL